MKKLFFLLAITSTLSCLEAQEAEVIKDAEYYRQKSHNQKISAWSLLGGGTLLVAAGSTMAANNLEIFSSETNSKYDFGVGMFLTGGAAMLSSIPLFIASARNKGRSMRATAGVKMEKVTVLESGQFLSQSIPALRLQFRLE